MPVISSYTHPSSYLEASPLLDLHSLLWERLNKGVSGEVGAWMKGRVGVNRASGL